MFEALKNLPDSKIISWRGVKYKEAPAIEDGYCTGCDVDYMSELCYSVATKNCIESDRGVIFIKI
jgi:hypothetical protein